MAFSYKQFITHAPEGLLIVTESKLNWMMLLELLCKRIPVFHHRITTKKNINYKSVKNSFNYVRTA